MSDRELIQRRTSLSANIVGFCRFLRQKAGFYIGPAEETDALLALDVLEPYNSPDDFRLSLKAALARTYSQQLQFDELYREYWKEIEKAVDAKVADGKKERKSPAQGQSQQPSLQALKSWLYGDQAEEETEMATYSTHQTTGRKDFSTFTEDELWEVSRLIQAIARSLAMQYSRRQQKSRSAARLDLRRTLRLNMRRGGEILDLAFRRQKKKKQQLVLLCDVSRSMDLYSQFLIQFIYAFQNAYRRIETFVFSTSLHRVTRQLRQRDFQTALDELSEEVTGWSGGTRIGESMETFVQRYASRMLNRQTIVLIMSDGWDTGDADLLADSMKNIHKKAGKVIWLNPLAGNPSYRPTVRGMQAALPYIDVFAPAHNVESLRQVAGHLRKRRYMGKHS